MPFTPQEEAQIRSNLNSLSESDKQKHTSTPQATVNYLGSIIGASAINYTLNKYGWPAIEKKVIEIIRKL